MNSIGGRRRARAAGTERVAGEGRWKTASPEEPRETAPTSPFDLRIARFEVFLRAHDLRSLTLAEPPGISIASGRRTLNGPIPAWMAANRLLTKSESKVYFSLINRTDNHGPGTIGCREKKTFPNRGLYKTKRFPKTNAQNYLNSIRWCINIR